MNARVQGWRGEIATFSTQMIAFLLEFARMDLSVHDEILWHACVLAERRLSGTFIGDPRLAFPYLVRGSWMNDTNQVSPLLDMNRKIDVDSQQQVLFHGLWKLSLDDLLEHYATLPGGDILRQHAPRIAGDDQNVDGFGSYQPYDHLDVVNDVAAGEYDADWASTARAGRAATADYTVMHHIPDRLSTSTLDMSVDVRLDPQRLTVLGRALHTVADFFSHSNYVELLLWSLAWRGELDHGIVDSFNDPDDGTHAGRTLFRCPLPLPTTGAADRKALLRNALIWYGREPAATPLVSAVFDLKDTTFSLLHMYAAHLVRTDGRPQTDAMLDLAMAVFDVQGAKFIKGAWSLFESVGDVFRGVGRTARSVLAAGIDVLAATKKKQESEALHIVASLVRRYDNKEAADWAQSGKLSYLARELQLDLVRGLQDQKPEQALLPHHSLIAKDHVVNEAGGLLRFKLACLLATEVSAEIVAWHFSPTPENDRFGTIANTVLIHPWRLFEEGGFDANGLAARVRAADGSARWERLALDDFTILGTRS